MGEMRENAKGMIKSYLSGFLRACIVGALVLAQFGFIIALTIWLRNYTVYFYTIIEMLSILIALMLVNDNRSPSYKFAWICIILILPLTGHIMYVLWGKSDSKKKIERKVLSRFRRAEAMLEYEPEVLQAFKKKYPTKSRMVQYMESEHFPLTRNNQVEYFPMGEDVFDDIICEIRKAKRFILMNFFIVAQGALWNQIHEELLKKLSEGVEVRFMYDDFGAVLRTPKYFKRDLEEEGFKIAVFNPIHQYTEKLYMNYRSHQKILVIDGNIGYTGGINLADEYVNLVERFGVWKDNGIKVRGDAVWGLTVTFLKMWEVSVANEAVNYDWYRPTDRFEENEVYCQVISDGPANHPKNPIESVYQQMIHYAKEYLYVTTPYLILEDSMADTLVMAARSGVDVRIITPYIPDKKNVKVLTNYNYGRLLEGGVRIYEYTPGFIHAKTILNEDCAIVGTINMDYRSFYLHYECGVWVCNREAVQDIYKDLLATFEQSKEITLAEWQRRPLPLKMYQWVLNIFSTLL